MIPRYFTDDDTGDAEESQQNANKFYCDNVLLIRKQLRDDQKTDFNFLDDLYALYEKQNKADTPKGLEIANLLHTAARKEWKKRKRRDRQKQAPVKYLYKEMGEDKVMYYNHAQNLKAVLQEHDVAVKYNEMIKDVEIDIPGREFHDDLENTAKLSALKGLCALKEVPYTQIEEHLVEIINDHVYHPVRDYLTTWSGMVCRGYRNC